MEPVLTVLMYHGIPATTKPQTPPWQRLLAPMLLASLGLHGVILMVPTGASGDKPIPLPDPEQDNIAISRVPPTAPASPADATLGNRPAAHPTGAGQVPPSQGPAALGAIAQIQRPSAPTNHQPAASTPRNPGQTQASPRTQGNDASGHASDSPSTAPRPTAPRTGTAPAPSPNQTPVAPPIPSAPPADSQPLSGNDRREQLQAYAAHLNLPQEQIDRLAASIRRRFHYDAVASADQIFPINQTLWQTAIRQDTGLVDLAPEALPAPVPLVYRQRVCLAQEPGPVKMGIVVNPDGSHHGDPVVLQSSGYGAVDEKALKALADQPLPTADHLKAYVFTVDPELDYGRNPCIDPNPAS